MNYRGLVVTVVVTTLLSLALTAGHASKPAPTMLVPLSRCMPSASDYTYLWWANGFRGRSPDERRLRCLQTGTYGMEMDVEKMGITHLGPLSSRHSDYGQAAVMDRRLLNTLPAADLSLTMRVDGTEYRCVHGGLQTQQTGARLIDSGRYVQRADITDLVFADAQGHRLAVNSRFEMMAWPDRLTLCLDAAPGITEPAGGHAFGRVGGGFYFDGHNALTEPNAPDLDPSLLTLETWIYLPNLPQVDATNCWIACKNGNEWQEGCYGLMLQWGVPVAILNIGGGRDRVFRAPGSGLPRDRWNHLAMTYDGTMLRLYVNGHEQGMARIGQPRVSGTGGLTFGRREDNSGEGYHFHGGLDEIRLYHRALSAEEIAAHAASPETVGPDPALARVWTFDPNGPSAPALPAARWKTAALNVRLHTGGRIFTARTELKPGEVWTAQQVKTAFLSLRPSARGMEKCTADTAVVVARRWKDNHPCPVAYDPMDGCYRVTLNDPDFRKMKPDQSDRAHLVRIRVTLSNPDVSARAVRLVFHQDDCTPGMSPMLRDSDGAPCGIPVQISKNWHRQPDVNLVFQGPWLHGYTLLHVPAHAKAQFEFTLAHAFWGGVPAASHAQLCLIGWGSNQLWNESALGDWGESICYEPDEVQAQTTICDVRPLLVHAMNNPTPVEWSWTNNVGGGDFFRWFDGRGQRLYPIGIKTAVHRQGPNLTEVTYAGQGAGDAFDQNVTVCLYRTDDIIRGLYHLRMRVKRQIDLSRFVCFQVGADTYNSDQRKMALGNTKGLLKEWNAKSGGNRYQTAPLRCSGRLPWISLHEGVSQDKSGSGAWANRGIVIRQWRARFDGKPAAPWIAAYGTGAEGTGSSLIDLIPPPGVRRLLPGDYLDAVVEHVVVPQYARDYYGPNANLRAALKKEENTCRMIAREAIGNDLAVQVSRGTLESNWPVRVCAAEGREASFTVAGGLGYVPITISGLHDYHRPQLEIREAGGDWKRVDQSVEGHDYWQADYSPADRSWELTYTVPLDTLHDARKTRAFRFRMEVSPKRGVVLRGHGGK